MGSWYIHIRFGFERGQLCQKGIKSACGREVKPGKTFPRDVNGVDDDDADGGGDARKASLVLRQRTELLGLGEQHLILHIDSFRRMVHTCASLAHCGRCEN